MSIQERVTQRLQNTLEIEHMELVNESYMHNVPPDSESHFRLVVVSDSFEDTMPVKRHQMVYRILSDEIMDVIHALSLHTYTSSEWSENLGRAPESPPCQHRKE